MVKERLVLRCVHLATGVSVSGFDADGRLVLPGAGQVTVGRTPSCDLRVSGALIGGQKNCIVETGEDGACVLHHSGHALPVGLNGALLWPLESRAITPGDVIEPIAADGVIALRIVLRRE